MAIIWDWDKKIGRCFMTATDKDGNKGVAELDLYQGNAYLIAIQEDKEEETYQLVWFATDKNHLKNMLGLSKGFDNCIKDWGILSIHLNGAKYKDAAEVAGLFLKAKMDTEFILYRKEDN